MSDFNFEPGVKVAWCPHGSLASQRDGVVLAHIPSKIPISEVIRGSDSLQKKFQEPGVINRCGKDVSRCPRYLVRRVEVKRGGRTSAQIWTVNASVVHRSTPGGGLKEDGRS